MQVEYDRNEAVKAHQILLKQLDTLKQDSLLDKDNLNKLQIDKDIFLQQRKDLYRGINVGIFLITDIIKNNHVF